MGREEWLNKRGCRDAVHHAQLVALWILGRLDLPRELYDEVLIPQAAHEEFLAVIGHTP